MTVIARRFHTTIGAITDCNQLTDPDNLTEGQTLVIPAPSSVQLVATLLGGGTTSGFELTLTGVQPGEPVTFAINLPDGSTYTGSPHVASADGEVTTTYQTSIGPGVYGVVATGDQGTRRGAPLPRRSGRAVRFRAVEPRGINGVARHDPDRIALIAGDRRITFGELDADANRVAHALTDAGVTAGDRVAVMMQNRPELFAVWNGVARVGALVVPVSYRSLTAEVAYLVTDSGATALVLRRRGRRRARAPRAHRAARFVARRRRRRSGPGRRHHRATTTSARRSSP